MKKAVRNVSPQRLPESNRNEEVPSPGLNPNTADFFLTNETGSSNNIKVLREYYSTAKSLSAEFSNASNLSLPLRVHSQAASRVYSALSTLLYSSISIAKADELERYIRKKAAQLPRSLIDIDQWVYVLQVAKECREGPENRALLQELDLVKQDSRALLYSTAVATSQTSNDWRKLKDDVESELGSMQKVLDDAKSMIRTKLLFPKGVNKIDFDGRPKSAAAAALPTSVAPNVQLVVSSSTSNLQDTLSNPAKSKFKSSNNARKLAFEEITDSVADSDSKGLGEIEKLKFDLIASNALIQDLTKQIKENQASQLNLQGKVEELTVKLCNAERNAVEGKLSQTSPNLESVLVSREELQRLKNCDQDLEIMRAAWSDKEASMQAEIDSLMSKLLSSQFRPAAVAPEAGTFVAIGKDNSAAEYEQKLKSLEQQLQAALSAANAPIEVAVTDTPTFVKSTEPALETIPLEMHKAEIERAAESIKVACKKELSDTIELLKAEQYQRIEEIKSQAAKKLTSELHQLDEKHIVEHETALSNFHKNVTELNQRHHVALDELRESLTTANENLIEALNKRHADEITSLRTELSDIHEARIEELNIMEEMAQKIDSLQEREQTSLTKILQLESEANSASKEYSDRIQSLQDKVSLLVNEISILKEQPSNSDSSTAPAASVAADCLVGSILVGGVRSGVRASKLTEENMQLKADIIECKREMSSSLATIEAATAQKLDEQKASLMEEFKRQIAATNNMHISEIEKMKKTIIDSENSRLRSGRDNQVVDRSTSSSSNSPVGTDHNGTLPAKPETSHKAPKGSIVELITMDEVSAYYEQIFASIRAKHRQDIDKLKAELASKKEEVNQLLRMNAVSADIQSVIQEALVSSVLKAHELSLQSQVNEANTAAAVVVVDTVNSAPTSEEAIAKFEAIIESMKLTHASEVSALTSELSLLGNTKESLMSENVVLKQLVEQYKSNLSAAQLEFDEKLNSVKASAMIDQASLRSVLIKDIANHIVPKDISAAVTEATVVVGHSAASSATIGPSVDDLKVIIAKQQSEIDSLKQAASSVTTAVASARVDSSSNMQAIVDQQNAKCDMLQQKIHSLSLELSEKNKLMNEVATMLHDKLNAEKVKNARILKETIQNLEAEHKQKLELAIIVANKQNEAKLLSIEISFQNQLENIQKRVMSNNILQLKQLREKHLGQIEQLKSSLQTEKLEELSNLKVIHASEIAVCTEDKLALIEKHQAEVERIKQQFSLEEEKKVEELKLQQAKEIEDIKSKLQSEYNDRINALTRSFEREIEIRKQIEIDSKQASINELREKYEQEIKLLSQQSVALNTSSGSEQQQSEAETGSVAVEIAGFSEEERKSLLEKIANLETKLATVSSVAAISAELDKSSPDIMFVTTAPLSSEGQQNPVSTEGTDKASAVDAQDITTRLKEEISLLSEQLSAQERVNSDLQQQLIRFNRQSDSMTNKDEPVAVASVVAALATSAREPDAVSSSSNAIPVGENEASLDGEVNKLVSCNKQLTSQIATLENELNSAKAEFIAKEVALMSEIERLDLLNKSLALDLLQLQGSMQELSQFQSLAANDSTQIQSENVNELFTQLNAMTNTALLQQQQVLPPEESTAQEAVGQEPVESSFDRFVPEGSIDGELRIGLGDDSMEDIGSTDILQLGNNNFPLAGDSSVVNMPFVLDGDSVESLQQRAKGIVEKLRLMSTGRFGTEMDTALTSGDIQAIQMSQLKDFEGLQSEMHRSWQQLKEGVQSTSIVYCNEVTGLKDSVIFPAQSPEGNIQTDPQVMSPFQMINRLKTLTAALVSDQIANNGNSMLGELSQLSVNITELQSPKLSSHSQILAAINGKAVIPIADAETDGIVLRANRLLNQLFSLTEGAAIATAPEQQSLLNPLVVNDSVSSDGFSTEVAQIQQRAEALLSSRINSLVENHLLELERLRELDARMAVSRLQVIQAQHQSELRALHQEFSDRFRQVELLWSIVRESYECELLLLRKLALPPLAQTTVHQDVVAIGRANDEIGSSSQERVLSDSSASSSLPAAVESVVVGLTALNVSTDAISKAVAQVMVSGKLATEVAISAPNAYPIGIDAVDETKAPKQPASVKREDSKNTLFSPRDSFTVSKLRDNEANYLKQIEKQLSDYSSLAEAFEIEKSQSAAKSKRLTQLENIIADLQTEIDSIRAKLSASVEEIVSTNQLKESSEKALNENLLEQVAANNRLKEQLANEKELAEFSASKAKEFEELLQQIVQKNKEDISVLRDELVSSARQESPRAPALAQQDENISAATAIARMFSPLVIDVVLKSRKEISPRSSAVNSPRGVYAPDVEAAQPVATPSLALAPTALAAPAPEVSVLEEKQISKEELQSEIASILSEKYNEQLSQIQISLNEEKQKIFDDLSTTIGELRRALASKNKALEEKSQQLEQVMARVNAIGEGSIYEGSQDGSSDMVFREGSIDSGGSALRRINDEFRLLQQSEAYRTKCTIKMQALSRGFLLRNKLKRDQLAELATSQGVLVAYPGTKQGRTGWYQSGEMFFYFCLAKGEFILLCGPITKELYQIAEKELNAKLQNENIILKFPKDIAIDRLAVHATRVQIETLTEDLRDAEDQLMLTQRSFESYRMKVLQDFQAMQERVDQELQSQLLRQAEGYEVRIKLLEETLHATEVENSKLFRKNLHRVPVLWSPRGLLTSGSSTEAIGKIIKLQSRIRAFIARNKYLRTRTYVSAKQSGVLVAVQGTKQGDSGWYVEPSGSIFYFVLVKGEWIPVVGPISREDFEANRRKIPQSLHIGAGVQYRCSFDLSIKHDNVHGDLYMSHQTGRLYIATSVEQLLLSSSVYGGDMLSSIGSDKFDELSM